MTTHAASVTKTPIDASPAQPDPADLAWLTALGGRFVVFDGPDGSGKTTQFNRFLDLARDAGLTVCDVREPGGTAIGEKIRDILLDKTAGAMSPTCEMLLYMASRAQLVEERIRPALARGELPVLHEVEVEVDQVGQVDELCGFGGRRPVERLA